MDAQKDCKTIKTPCGEFSYAQLIKVLTIVFLAGMIYMQFKINQVEIKETKTKTEANTQAIAGIQSTVDGIDKTTQTILKHILQKK